MQRRIALKGIAVTGVVAACSGLPFRLAAWAAIREHSHFTGRRPLGLAFFALQL